MKRFVEGVNEVANSIAGKPPASLEELLDLAEKHIRLEEATKPDVGQNGKTREEEKPGPMRGNKNESSRREFKRKQTLLSETLVKVMYVTQRHGIIEPLREMMDNLERAQSDQYCRFH
ncbi:hypothetical protein DH2020_003690 [Rehmannia glutinosa]|uniref:Uncharacterized protein n=1 Tax=Rehmannia glutinosa TaxID=99300 RepID=A0ABR0XME1_REHGL